MKKMLCLVFLLPFFGDITIAAVPTDTPPSSPNSTVGLASIMKHQDQLIQSLKTNLKQSNFMQQLAKDTLKFNEFSQTYSLSVLPMLRNLSLFIVRGEDNVFDAIKPAYGWCSTATLLLEAYISLFEEHDSESADAQKEIIKSLFSENIPNPVSSQLNTLSDNLNKASSTLSSIFTQLDQDYTDQSAFFASKLRHEILEDTNNRYTSELIIAAIKAMQRVPLTPAELIRELASAAGAVKIGETAVEHQQENGQVTEPLTFDPKLCRQYRSRVLSRFGKTLTFFKNFEEQLNKSIRDTNDVQSKLSENNQRYDTSGVNENLATIPSNAAEKNQLKSAARMLMNQCKNFIQTPVN